MKALLLEDKDKRKNRAVMVLLPSGKLESGLSDPANIAIEKDGKDIKVWLICADEIASLQLVKEVEVEGRFLIDALEYGNSRVEYLREELKFKNRLQGLVFTLDCDAYRFLDTGSVVL